MSNERRWKKDGIRMLLVVCGGNLEMKMMFFLEGVKKTEIVKGWNLDGNFDY